MNGPFGNKFPYTNFHEMNLDWMIQIARDFLDQYTNIQNTIDQGLEDLEAKKTELEGLLDAWYNEHSEDIAGQLADALQDLNDWYTLHEHYLDETLSTNITAFEAAADAKTAESLASIPDDYTALSAKADNTAAELEELYDTQYGLLARGNFDRDAYNPQTQETFTYQYRISSRQEIIFPFDIDLVIASGFRITPYLLNGSNVWTSQGWKTGTYHIYANIGFYVQIARVTEDTSEVANITTFLQAVKVTGNPIEKATDQIGNVHQILRWYQGGMRLNTDINRYVVDPTLTDRIISQRVPLATSIMGLLKESGYRFGTVFFDKDDVYIGQTVSTATIYKNEYFATTVEYLKQNFPTADPYTTYVRFVVIYPNNTLTPDAGPGLVNIVYQDPANPVVESGKQVKVYKFSGGSGNWWCFVRTPENYNPYRNKPYPFVICNHGNGWVMDGSEEKANWTKRTMYVPLTDPDYLNDPTEYNGTADSSLWYSNPTIEALLTAGYVVCGCENYGDNLYGNNNCRNACVDFFFHMVKTWNVENRCYMIGASNGALTSLNAAYLLQGRVKAMILQYPLTCLVNQYEHNSSQQADIRTAYGITDPDISLDDLAAAVITHDPLTTDVIDGIKAGPFPPTKIWYSPQDITTRANYNAIPFAQMLANSKKVVATVECSGEHGDHTHFDPPAYVAWFDAN